MFAALAGAAVGGLIGAGGSWLGSWWTGRQAKRKREQKARQDVLRLLHRVAEALDDESKIDQERSDAADVQRYDLASAAVDSLCEELTVLVTDLPQKERQRLDLCIEALRERTQLGPHPDSVGHRARSTIQQLVTAELRDEPLKDWTSAVLKDFAESLELVHEMREEAYRAQEEWRQKEREWRKVKRNRRDNET